MGKIPFEFVLEALERISPRTNPMFGCTAVYHGEKIVLILREKEDGTEDNGVWLATTGEHHASLQKDFPSMRSIALFGPGPTGWQVLPTDAPDFEEAALRACRLVMQNDPRIGKIPKRRKLAKATQAKKGAPKNVRAIRSKGRPDRAAAAAKRKPATPSRRPKKRKAKK